MGKKSIGLVHSKGWAQNIFLTADIENQAISSKMVKEIASLKGNVTKFAPKPAIMYLKKNINAI